MEEGKKKIIMVIIIVVCLVAAVVITVASHHGGVEGGVDTIKRGEMVWIKCRNPKCEYAWQMDRKDYYEYIENNRNGTMIVPGIVCPKCGEKDGYLAYKCPKCGTVFEKVLNDLPDRCPKCGYSAMEELRKKTGGARRAAPTPAAPAVPATSETK
jgi:DNA-directed RNA polymerase subunit RPC12/RpoP